MATRAAVLYARISVSTEESVSVQRQIASARKYAAARGWRVVGEFIDDGVSATRNKPEHRPGWRSLMASSLPFDAVVIWKVDRLARRVIDFLRADETLQARGAAIVCVEQSIDMTTGEGRAFAQMLAVFGEMEASAISSRIMAARAHLMSEGRIPGGRQPYGWMSIPNPDGAGYVRAQDPERIEWVRGMVERVLRGDTVYSVMTWLNEAGAPGPRVSNPGRTGWGYSSVNVLMRNPVLAGMFARDVHAGYGANGGPELRRDTDGNPVISDDGIISVEQYEQLQYAINHKVHGSARIPRPRSTTSPLLAQLARCSDCDRLMNRHRGSDAPGFHCRFCGQTVRMAPLIDHVVQHLLGERGAVRMYRRTLVVPDDPAASRRLAGIEHALRSAAIALTDDRTDAEALALTEEVASLKKARIVARKKVRATAMERLTYVGTVAQVWSLCADDEQRREVLATQVESLLISKSITKTSRFSPQRVRLTWRSDSKPLVPEGVSVGPIHHRMNAPSPWISYRDASRLLGSNETLIRKGIKSGEISRRETQPQQPSLERASVIAYLRAHNPQA